MQYQRIFRFGFVGIMNAAISFGILNLAFYRFGQSKIASSLIATACALLFSFALNRFFVFADRSKQVREQFMRFVIVTISGSFIVINLVYVVMLQIMSGHEAALLGAIKDVTGLTLSQSFVVINLSTVVGAVIAMVWNYNGYRLFVFKESREDRNDKAVTTNKEIY